MPGKRRHRIERDAGERALRRHVAVVVQELADYPIAVGDGKARAGKPRVTRSEFERRR